MLTIKDKSQNQSMPFMRGLDIESNDVLINIGIQEVNVTTYRDRGLPSYSRAFAPTKKTVVSSKPWVLAFPGTKEVTRAPHWLTPAPVPLADPPSYVANFPLDDSSKLHLCRLPLGH